MCSSARTRSRSSRVAAHSSAVRSEQRRPVGFRDDGAAAWNYVGWITRVSGRGVDAEVVLEVQVRLAQPVVIAKDAAFDHRTVLLAARASKRIEPSSRPGVCFGHPRHRKFGGSGLPGRLVIWLRTRSGVTPCPVSIAAVMPCRRRRLRFRGMSTPLGEGARLEADPAAVGHP